jgi:hypothetical protein
MALLLGGGGFSKVLIEVFHVILRFLIVLSLNAFVAKVKVMLGEVVIFLTLGVCVCGLELVLVPVLLENTCERLNVGELFLGRNVVVQWLQLLILTWKFISRLVVSLILISIESLVLIIDIEQSIAIERRLIVFKGVLRRVFV